MITLLEYLYYKEEAEWRDGIYYPHLKEIQEYNKSLIEAYPFLRPRNRWTDEIAEDYDYSWTELDAMPIGWRIRFGDEMVEEISQELKRCDYEYEYRILQIKEKWGELRWYDSGLLEGCKVWDIINKYSALSRIICIKCGDLATKESQDWVSPFCEACAQDIEEEERETFRDITVEEYDRIRQVIEVYNEKIY